MLHRRPSRRRAGPTLVPLLALTLLAAACAGEADSEDGPTSNGGDPPGGSGRECSRDADCGVGRECDFVNGSCRDFGCDSTAQCAQGQYCDPVSRECVAGCDRPEDCPGRTVCNTSTHRCEPDNRCQSDQGCRARERCRDEKCVDVECMIDAHCPQGELCDLVGNQCVSADRCANDADCVRGEKCSDTGKCEPAGCRGDGDCQGDEVCNVVTGECGPGGDGRCDGPDDCADGQVCDLDSESCIAAECARNEDCGEGRTCRARRCIDEPGCRDDPLEPNDTRDGFRLVQPGEVDALTACDDEDWFGVQANAGDEIEVTIRFAHAEGDLALAIFQPQRPDPLDSSNGEADSETVTVPGAPVSGVYRILVSGPDGATNGYRMSVSIREGEAPCADDGVEENDGPDAATAVEPGRLDDLHVCPGDADWFRIDVNANDRLAVTVRFSHQEGDLDLEIRGPDNALLAEARSEDDDETASIGPVGLAGPYRIRVAGANDAAEASYALEVAITPGELGPCREDGLEENESHDSPRLIGAGTFSGLSICEGDADWYAIQAVTGEGLTVRIRFPHEAGDIDLEVYRPDNADEPEARSVSVTDDEEVSINDLPVDGLWRVRVYGFRAAENRYDLEVIRVRAPVDCEDDPAEDDDSRIEAGFIAPGAHGGRQACANDDDWYRFRADRGASIRVVATFIDEFGDVDMALYREGGADEPLRTAASTSDNEEIVVDAVEASGGFFLRVHGYRGAQNAYALNLEVRGGNPGCADDAEEPNDARLDAGVISDGSLENLAICEADADWYAVDADAGGALLVGLAFSHEAGDIDMRVHSPSGSVAGLSASVTDDEEVEVQGIAASGRYLVEVYGYRGATNAYELTLVVEGGACEDDPREQNDGASSARVLADGDLGPIEGLSICAGDEDWWSIDVQAGQSLEVSAEFVHVRGDLDLVAFAPDGSLVAVSSSTSDRETVRVAATRSGPHLVRVHGWRGAANAYTLVAAIE